MTLVGRQVLYSFNLIVLVTKTILACRHMCLLQLLYTAGGNQARLDARTEFKNLEPLAKGGGGSRLCIELYLRIIVTSFGYGRENHT